MPLFSKLGVVWRRSITVKKVFIYWFTVSSRDRWLSDWITSLGSQHSIQVMWLRRPLSFRRFKKAVRRLIVALTAGSISFSLLFTFWGRHSDDTVDEFSAFTRTIGGVGSEDENTVAARVPHALNVHVWRMQCGSNVTYLKKSLFFPKYPDEEKFINDFQIEDDSVDYGQKIFGYLHPQRNGLYRFAIASDDTSELWISTDENPYNKRLVARVFTENAVAWTGKDELDKYPEQRSKEPLHLQANKKYYVEVLHQNVSSCYILYRCNL